MDEPSTQPSLLTDLILTPIYNGSGDYRFCGTIRDYLRQRADRTGISFEPRFNKVDKIACRAAGIRQEKFKAFLKEWHDIRRPIPLGYLDVIGVQRHVLESLLEHDRDLFQKAAFVERRPVGFTIRVVPAIYQSLLFPEDLTTEAQCIAHAQKAVDSRTGMIGWINFPEIKTIWLYEKKPSRTVFYGPSLRWRKKDLLFRSTGVGIGTVRI